MEREITNGELNPAREPWTVRVAVWSARHRWPVFAAWFVLVFGLMFGASALGGQNTQSIMEQGQVHRRVGCRLERLRRRQCLGQEPGHH